MERIGREPIGLAFDPEGPDIQRLRKMKWGPRLRLQAPVRIAV
jgi:hypothetical protein